VVRVVLPATTTTTAAAPSTTITARRRRSPTTAAAAMTLRRRPRRAARRRRRHVPHTLTQPKLSSKQSRYAYAATLLLGLSLAGCEQNKNYGLVAGNGWPGGNHRGCFCIKIKFVIMQAISAN
jgi:hypothetical protein